MQYDGAGLERSGESTGARHERERDDELGSKVASVSLDHAQRRLWRQRCDENTCDTRHGHDRVQESVDARNEDDGGTPAMGLR